MGLTRTQVTLDGHTYQLSHTQADTPKGSPKLAWSTRPSQPGDPSERQQATWRVDGPNLNSYEDISGEGTGYLGICFCSGCDSRFSDTLVLGPLLNTVDLSLETETEADCHAAAVVDNGTNAFAYICRGEKPGKLKLDDMTKIDTGITLSAAASSVIATKSVAGTQEVAFGFATSTDYHVITTIGATTDTSSANDDNEDVAIFGQGLDNRIFGLGGGANPLRVAGNILTGTTDMDDPNWQEIATLSGPANITFTGFALDGDEVVLGTNYGPYVLDTDGEFFPVWDTADPSADACREMVRFFDLGLVIITPDGVRWYVAGQGGSWGVETFPRNTCPIQGDVTAHTPSSKWLYQSLKSTVNDNYYLVAWRPVRVGDPHIGPMQPFVIANLGTDACKFLRYVGTAQGRRSTRALIGGKASDVFYLLVGDTVREFEDSNYEFTTTGTAHLTELRRQPAMIKDIEKVEFSTAGCSSDETVTVGIAVDGGTTQDLSGNLLHPDGATQNGVVTTNGLQEVWFVDDQGKPLAWAAGADAGVRLKPRITMARGSTATNSPRIEGEMVLTYALRPRMTRVTKLELSIGGTGEGDAQIDRLEALAASGGGPVELYHDGERHQVRVDRVSMGHAGKDGKRVVDVELTRWAVLDG